MSALRRLKDVALEKGVLHFVRPKLERYGELKLLKINTSKKIVSGEMHLLGEDAPLVISQARYRLEQEGERLFAVVYHILVSKPWLQNLVDDQFDEMRIEVPASFKSLVKHLL